MLEYLIALLITTGIENGRLVREDCVYCAMRLFLRKRGEAFPQSLCLPTNTSLATH